MPPLETPRLVLSPLCSADAPAIQRLFADWEIVRWLNDTVPWPYPDDGAATFVNEIALPAMDKGEAWHWSIKPKVQPDRLIGVISLVDQPDDNRGFWLDPAWQCRGLMTEASDAATDFWFEDLGRQVLRVPKAVANAASRRISEKRGMRVIGRFPKALVSGVHDTELWEIGRDEWRAARGKT